MVEVQLQDLVLREPALDLPGDPDLEDLPAQRPLLPGQPVREHVPGELHGDGAGALDESAGAQVRQDSAKDRGRINLKQFRARTGKIIERICVLGPLVDQGFQFDGCLSFVIDHLAYPAQRGDSVEKAAHAGSKRGIQTSG